VTEITKIKAGIGRCEESSLHMPALPCNAPATTMIAWPNRAEGPYRMCNACANHSLKNRGAVNAGPYDGPPHEEYKERAKTEKSELEPVFELTEEKAATLFKDKMLFAEFVELVKTKAAQRAEGLSVQIESDREELARIGRDIAGIKRKTEAIGKALGEEAHKTWKSFTTLRGEYVTAFQAIQDDIEAPVKAWKEEEKLRVDQVNNVIDRLAANRTVPYDMPSADIAARLTKVKAFTVDKNLFRERTQEAQVMREEAIKALEAGITAAAKREADSARLALLEAQEREREQREAAQKAEAERKANEEARIAQAAAEQSARAQREAQEQIERQQREHEAEMARVKADSEAKERARMEEEARQAAQKAEREANEAHRASVALAMSEAIQGLGLSESDASQIVRALINGDVPYTVVHF